MVDDLAAATEFFVELGLEPQGEGLVEGRWVDRVVGLDGLRAEIAILQTQDGHGPLDLTKVHTPSTQGDKRTRQRHAGYPPRRIRRRRHRRRRRRPARPRR